MHLATVFATALLASAAAAQVTIPPHASIYNGYSRGFNFTANVSFFIVGLSLPTDAYQTGDTAGYLVRVNGTVALHSVGNVGAITTNIPIVTGDIVDVIGNWSPAAPGSFTAHNSYTASMTNFATTIEGVPHTIQRTGWQYDIGVSPLTGTYLAPTTGAMGRVNIFTSSGGSGTVFATNTTLGAGCGQTVGSFYEAFANTAAVDLSNTTFTWLNTGTGYTVLSSLPGTFVPPTPAASNVAPGLLDGQQLFPLPGPMPSPGGPVNTLNVTTKGQVELNSPGTAAIDYTPTAAELLAWPTTVFALWHDYNQTSAGSGLIYFEVVGNVAYVTWNGVHSYLTTAPDTFQFQFDLVTGNVTLVIGALGNASVDPVVVGFSPAGASPDPGATDLSSLTALVLSVPEAAALSLSGTSRPVTNTSWNLSLTNVPANGVLGVDVFGGADPGLNDLSFLGLPGCGLRASLDALSAWLVTGPSHTFGLPVPNVPALVNQHFFVTSAVFQNPPTNAFGAITANGIDGKIGDY